jgi:hypothetical protein
MSILKLPKDVVADPRHDALVSLLAKNTSLLWERGHAPVPTLPMTDALATVLRRALAEGHASQGLEHIGDVLAGEQKGLDALKRKAPESPQNARVSRILFISNDGSPRFYRDVDALLARYPQRLLVCRLDISGEELGPKLVSSDKLIRSVLVTDKRIGALALLALLPRAE